MSTFPVNWRRVGAFFGIAILILIVIEFNARLEEWNRLTEEADVYRAQATQAAQTKVALQTQVAYASSDAAVEEYAREENHMILEGEIPGVPVGNENSPPIFTPTPTPISTLIPNWQVWWGLFFGK